VNKNYPTKDFHRFYIGEIKNVWIKERKIIIFLNTGVAVMEEV
jgi:hypothetical protein